MTEELSQVLRTVASALLPPVLIVLIVLMAGTVFLVGTLVVEIFTERMRLKAKLPLIADRLRSGENLKEVIETSGLLKRQRAALLEVTAHPALTPAMREALAVKLIDAEREHYEGVVRLSEIVARLVPMFGLLGTLIPLGPGIIALGRGDTFTLSQSLLVAFDTTIAGLISAAVAFVISTVRKKWYAGYMTSLEMTMECLLEQLTDNSEELKVEVAV